MAGGRLLSEAEVVRVVLDNLNTLRSRRSTKHASLPRHGGLPKAGVA